MPHYLDRPIGSDLSFHVLKMRARQHELTAQPLDSVNRTPYPVPVGCERHAFLADPDLGQDELTETPTWVFHGRRRRKG